MPRVTGPLFSIAASGRVGRVLQYRQTTRGSEVQQRSTRRAAPSTPQKSERARVHAAAIIWRTLDALTRAEWYAYAVIRGNNAWIEFCREYLLQQCTGETLPMIPALPFVEI